MNPLTAIIEEIQKDAGGAFFLHDWIGDGAQVVTQEQAESRAKVCVSANEGRACSMNRAPNWWETHFTDPIANAIRRQIQIKHKLSLKVTQEDDLHMCVVCGCPMPLKVWVPTEHIKSHTADRTFARFPDYCWIKKELTL